VTIFFDHLELEFNKTYRQKVIFYCKLIDT
jgi:hypothetical protein